jgi:hypothetical protein
VQTAAERLRDVDVTKRRSRLPPARANHLAAVEAMTGRENRDRVSLRRPTARNMHGYFLYG